LLEAETKSLEVGEIVSTSEKKFWKQIWKWNN